MAPTTWIVGVAAVVYTFAPIDLIPELVLGPFGFVDDIGLWGILAVLFAREQHRWMDGLLQKAASPAISSRRVN